jgi:hypothetical protein
MAEQRWSYHIAEIKPGFLGFKRDQLQTELNRLGAQGWELVQIQLHGMVWRAILKRPH